MSSGTTESVPVSLESKWKLLLKSFLCFLLQYLYLSRNFGAVSPVQMLHFQDLLLPTVKCSAPPASQLLADIQGPSHHVFRFIRRNTIDCQLVH